MSSVKQKEKKSKEEPKTSKQVTIPGVNIGKASLTIEGISPLLVHNFSAKSKTEIEDKQTGKAKAKKEFRDPDAEYKGSLYPIPGKKNAYGVPANGLKLSAVTACRYVDSIKQSFALGAFHVVGGPGNLVEIKGEPQRDDSWVKIGNFGSKVAMPRYRGRFDNWEITFEVLFNKNVISVEQIANLFETAGFAVGLCEWRPEKKGSHGMFRVKR